MIIENYVRQQKYLQEQQTQNDSKLKLGDQNNMNENRAGVY